MKKQMKRMLAGGRWICALVACCAIVTIALTSCKKDMDEFHYTIFVQPGGILQGEAAVNWSNAVMSIYQSALGVSSAEFTRSGSQEECDKAVFEACKKAEAQFSTLPSGTGDVIVHNATARTQPYRRTIP